LSFCIRFDILLLWVRRYKYLLTTNEDLDLTEVEHASSSFNLHDDVSAGRHFWGARLEYSGSGNHMTFVLSTYVVVPQDGRWRYRWHIRQSNDKVVRWLSAWKEEKETNIKKCTCKPEAVNCRKCRKNSLVCVKTKLRIRCAALVPIFCHTCIKLK